MDHPNPSLWWKHRRRGYYIAIAWTIVQTILWALLEMWKPGSTSSLTAVVGWSYGTSTIIITGYYSNTAIETYLQNKGSK